MSDADAERYPPHVHRLSPALTLQAAVAHSEMPVETGPTTYLPHSQKYATRYQHDHIMTIGIPQYTPPNLLINITIAI